MKSLMIVLGLLVSCTFSYRITVEGNDDGSKISSSGLSDLLSMILGKGDAGLGLGDDDGLGSDMEGDMSDAAHLYDVLGSSDDDEGLGLLKDSDLLDLVGGDEDGEDDDDVEELSVSLRELAKALHENKQTAEAETLNKAADVVDKLSEQMNKEMEGELKKAESELEKEAEKAAQKEDEENKMLETELTSEMDKETQEEANEQKEENKVLEQLDSTSPLP